MQAPRCDHRSADVAAAVDENARDSSEVTGPRQDTVRSAQEAVVRPVMRHQCGEVLALARVLVQRTRAPGRIERHVRRFPSVPGQRGAGPHAGIGVAEQTCVVCDHALAVWHFPCEFLPCLGEDPSDAFGDPVDLLPAAGRDGGQHDFGHSLRMRECVRQCERGSPRDAVQQPGSDSQVLAKRFYVVDERGRRVGVESVEIVDRPRCAAPASALIEPHDQMEIGVEAAPVATATQSAARATV